MRNRADRGPRVAAESLLEDATDSVCLHGATLCRTPAQGHPLSESTPWIFVSPMFDVSSGVFSEATLTVRADFSEWGSWGRPFLTRL